MRITLSTLLFAALLLPAPARAQAAPAPQATASPTPNDYSDPKTWLCRPGRQDACAVDLSTTIVAADGTLKKEPWAADPNAPIDCFYVYPTVSADQGANSGMAPGVAELAVVRQQFARFAAVCKPYAPMYRQTTLAALRRMFSGGGAAPMGRGLAYDDVKAAWDYYLAHDNKGRGVVLIGHSQGSFVLTRLLAEEIDGKPVQARLVSALIIGAPVAVPKGKDVGGSFQKIPLCHSASQTGCVVAYSSFRSTEPPPANTLFGRVPGAEMAAACTNPAALAGGSGELHPYFPNRATSVWETPVKPIDTPFVTLPGLVTAACSSNQYASGFLEVTVHGDPADPRTDDIPAASGLPGTGAAMWGLHQLDVNLAIGNLVDIVRQQAKAYMKK